MVLEFVHIPKTGGDAITRTYTKFRWGRFCDPVKLKQRIPHYPHGAGRRPCSFWHNHELISALYGDAITFCVFRDPVDRIVSEYRWQKKPDNIDVFNKTLAEWKTLVLSNPFFADNHLRPQHLFAEQCDHVLLFDRLEKDVEDLLRYYGYTPCPLMKRNQTLSNYKFVSRDKISPENMEWIMSYYAEDVEFYQCVKACKS
jgi:Sulfotransferase family